MNGLVLADIGNATPDIDVRRDRWGRYLVVPPEGGKPKGYTRATTVAKTLDDMNGLMSWKQRMTALGLAARPDILAMVIAADPDDKKALNGLCERAAEAGGATARRDLGTAIHKLVERKIAEPDWQVPDPYGADVDAVISAVDRAGYDIVPEYSEVVVVLDRHGIAGTADLILRRRSDDMLVVADLKTGSSVKYGALGFAVQLSIYAGADAIYRQGSSKDGSDDVREPMPPIDQSMALILHAEPDSGSCDVHCLDIARGAEALEVAMSVRRWRTEKELLVPLGTAVASKPASATKSSDAADAAPGVTPSDTASADDTDVHAERLAWVLARIEAVREAGHTRSIGERWPKDDTLPKPGDVRKGTATWTPEQLGAVVEILDAVEARWEMPFGDTDPAARESAGRRRRPIQNTTPPAGTLELIASLDHDDIPVDPAQVAELRDMVAAMPDNLRHHILRWAEQSHRCGVDWRMGQQPTMRRVGLSALAITLATSWVDLTAAVPDAVVRAGLATVLGADLGSHPTGAAIGCLTLEQAEALTSLLDNSALSFDEDGMPQLTAAT